MIAYIPGDWVGVLTDLIRFIYIFIFVYMWALHLKREALQSSLALNSQIHQCVFFPFSRIFGCPMIYEKKSINVSCSSSTKNPWCHDLILHNSPSLDYPKVGLQSWSCHGIPWPISWDIIRRWWVDLKRPEQKKDEMSWTSWTMVAEFAFLFKQPFTKNIC